MAQHWRGVYYERTLPRLSVRADVSPRKLGYLFTSPSLRVIPQALRHWAMGKEQAYHEALLRDPVSSPAKSDGNPSFDYTPLPGPAISPRARLHFYQTLNDEAPAG